MKQQSVQELTALLNPEQNAINSLEHLRDALTTMSQLRQSLTSLREAGFSLMLDTRSLKIIAQSRESPSKPFNFVPEIILRGNWLEAAGFECDQRVRVITMHQMLIICPETLAVTNGKKRRLV